MATDSERHAKIREIARRGSFGKWTRDSNAGYGLHFEPDVNFVAALREACEWQRERDLEKVAGAEHMMVVMAQNRDHCLTIPEIQLVMREELAAAIRRGGKS